MLVGAETHAAYDRPKLSKAVGLEASKIQLFTQAEYKSQGIETKLGVKVTSLDSAAKSVVLSNGETLTYDACLVATGAEYLACILPPLTYPGLNASNALLRTTKSPTRTCW